MRRAGPAQVVQEIAQSVDLAGESFGRGDDPPTRALLFALDHLDGGEGEIVAARRSLIAAIPSPPEDGGRAPIGRR